MSDPHGPLTLKLLGLEIPISRWSVSVFSLIAIVATSGVLYRQLAPDVSLMTLKEANERLKVEMDEYAAHLMEQPVLETSNADSSVSLKVYADGCVAIMRKTPRQVLTRLVVDLARAAQARASVESGGLLEALVPTVQAQGRCWQGVHPGRFATSYGRRLDTCWVEVVRTFEDGCQHIQNFNSCSGSWATNRDGSPQVRWTACRH